MKRNIIHTDFGSFADKKTSNDIKKDIKNQNKLINNNNKLFIIN